MKTRKIKFLDMVVFLLMAGALFLPQPAFARQVKGEFRIDKETIAADLAGEFKLGYGEVFALLEELEQASGNAGNFYYYLGRIKELSKSDKYTLTEFLKCITALKERAKADLVFDLIEGMNKLGARPYCIDSVLVDTKDLPAELKDVKQGFEALFNMLIEITRGDPKSKDVQPDAYDFLRRFEEEVIEERKWRDHGYMKRNFLFAMEKIAEIMAARLEQTSWDAFTQIDICLSRAKGDLEEAMRLLDEYYRKKRAAQKLFSP